MPFAETWMNLEMIILSAVSQTDKDKYNMISVICGIKKKRKQRHKFMATKGEWVGKG